MASPIGKGGGNKNLFLHSSIMPLQSSSSSPNPIPTPHNTTILSLFSLMEPPHASTLTARWRTSTPFSLTVKHPQPYQPYQLSNGAAHTPSLVPPFTLELVVPLNTGELNPSLSFSRRTAPDAVAGWSFEAHSVPHSANVTLSSGSTVAGLASCLRRVALFLRRKLCSCLRRKLCSCLRRKLCSCLRRQFCSCLRRQLCSSRPYIKVLVTSTAWRKLLTGITELKNSRKKTKKMGNQKQKWTQDEEDALIAGVEKHGPGKWKNILKDPQFAPFLTSRSNIDLKDKWRNLSLWLKLLYNAMVLEALSALKDANGSDLNAIVNFIEQKHKVPQNFRRALSTRLRRLVSQGKLEKVRAVKLSSWHLKLVSVGSINGLLDFALCKNSCSYIEFHFLKLHLGDVYI
ncbi:hypothetical protein Ahy_A09g046030 [Arachis hypogaea]|uniref:MYB transcription factor n=1 Tax=Arachis hypogaea TaxID=3818 RepID=A0A445BNQ1_ARAHY|nr:hypothetical protein Ahy_A09g046030 [Arachis hypogaea]